MRKTAHTKALSKGPSHEEARLLAQHSSDDIAVSISDLDPTQLSFARHMTSWNEQYRKHKKVHETNLPCMQGLDDQLVLLLGTAGTGKTTTLLATNAELSRSGLQDRIVRAAFTGVAASNMGSGSRTLMNLFRLGAVSSIGGKLEKLGTDDMQELNAELRFMAVLEIDEVSMLERLMLAFVHHRLQQWRYECYHFRYCSQNHCVCGCRMPFGGCKDRVGWRLWSDTACSSVTHQNLTICRLM